MWPTSVSRPEGSAPPTPLNRRGWILAGVGFGVLILVGVMATWLSAGAGRPTSPVYDNSIPAAARTWTWDGKDFTALPTTGPGPSSNDADMAFDRKSGNVVLWDHGCTRLVMGFTGGCHSLVDQTWTWAGQSWTRQQAATTPTAIGQGAMVYDAKLGQVVYVNRVGQAWAWTGSNWQAVARAGAPRLAEPGAAAGQSASLVAAGYDEARGQLVLALPSSTWTWDGQSWNQAAGGIEATDAQPDPRAVYDGAFRQLVFLGAGATWTWDGSHWLAHPQPNLGGGTAAYDPARKSLVVVKPDNNACDKTACTAKAWTWDGMTWSTAPAPHLPSLPLTRSGARNLPVAYDENRGLLVVFISAS